MLQVKQIAYILSAILLIITGSFLFYGLTTPGYYSLDYNVPIARTILSGKVFDLPANDPYIYFPGSSHIFLAFFELLNIPLNLFGLLSWIVLFFACKKLGDVYGLKKYMSFIFAAGVCTSFSIIRTIGDQSIDKWLCTWFVTSMILLENPKKTHIYSLLLGLSLGMLFGTKYSGPLFFIALLPLYIKPLLAWLSPVRFLISGVAFTISGLFWYIRNFILTSNPYYPANTPFFKGFPDYTQQDWMLWRVFIEYPKGIKPLFDSYLSEFLLWSFALAIVIWYVTLKLWKKQNLDSEVKKLALLILTTGLVCLFLPITPPYKIDLYHIISDMRYIYIFITLCVLAVFLIADKYKKNGILSSVVLISAVPLFSYLPYQPKIIVAALIIGFVVYRIFPKFVQRIIS